MQEFRSDLFVHPGVIGVEAAERNAQAARAAQEMVPDRRLRDASGVHEWEPVGAGGDGRKRDRVQLQLVGQFKGSPVTRGQKLRLTVVAAPPHRTHGVGDVLGGQPIRARQLHLSGSGSTQRATLGEQFLACRSMNGTIDPTAATQGRIGGIHDHIDVQTGNVIGYDLNPAV